MNIYIRLVILIHQYFVFLFLGDNKQHKIRHGHSHIIVDPDTEAQNCTVAYMSDCMSLNKCRQTCSSMGAARFRWFHEFGCCECIDSTCLDYGKGEALCSKCSADHLGDDEEEDDLIEDDITYDENEDVEYDDAEDGETEENTITGVPPLQVEEEQVVQEVPNGKNKVDRATVGATAQLNVDSLDNL